MTTRATLPQDRRVLLSRIQAEAEALRRRVANQEVAPADESAKKDLLGALDRIMSDPGQLAWDDASTARVQSYLEDLVLEPSSGLEAMFDEHDLGWIHVPLSLFGRLDKEAFIGPAERPERIGDAARIAMLGDWGTGLYGAPVSAATIETTKPAYDVLLHLGDVYYSGTRREVEEHFLALWPNVSGAISRALNANHEMYSGGHGYFGTILPSFGQASSCFALENEHFLLVGLDTGYEEGDLCHDQPAWLKQLVERAEASAQKVVLFSHHQPFSALDRQGDAIVDRLRPLLESRRIFAWYWGHEHRCAIYDPHPSWGLYGRLVGHGGFPYFRDRLGDRPLAKENTDGSAWRRVRTEGVPDAPERYGPNGFMTLALEADRLRERVHAPDGTVLYEAVLSGG
jgi:hypothetical protein